MAAIKFVVETSFIVHRPDEFIVSSLIELHSRVQQLANDRAGDYGQLSHKWRLGEDKDGLYLLCRFYFKGRDGRMRRFMRLKGREYASSESLGDGEARSSLAA